MSTNQKLFLTVFLLFLATRKATAKVLEGISIGNLWFVGTNSIPGGVEVILEIEVKNENPVGATIVGLDGNLEISGIEVSKVNLLERAVIPGSGMEKVPMIFTIDFITLAGNIINQFNTGNWISVGKSNGVITFSNGLEVPFSESIKLI